MHELIENVANKINTTLSVGRGKLAQEVGSVFARRAASKAIQQGSTVHEVFRLCESAFVEAGGLVTTEFLWAIDQSIYPRVSFAQELGQMGDRYMEQLGQITLTHLQKAESLAKAPPNQIHLQLHEVMERTQRDIRTAIDRRRIERSRSLLKKALGVLLSASVAGYLLKTLIAHLF